MTSTVLRAVLWDMDGVLVDSAQYHFDAWRRALQLEGSDMSEAAFRSTFGQRNDTVLRGLFGPDYSDADVARVSTVKEALYRDVVAEKGIDALPGVLRWLTTLHSAGWRQAVASAAPRDNVLAIVDELSIGGFFSAITSAEDVTRGKPDPQVYLTAAQRVNVLPNRCIVIEDAPAGVEGAKRANMRSIGVLTSHEELEADVVVTRLTELGDDAFERLLPA